MNIIINMGNCPESAAPRRANFIQFVMDLRSKIVRCVYCVETLSPNGSVIATSDPKYFDIEDTEAISEDRNITDESGENVLDEDGVIQTEIVEVKPASVAYTA